MIKLLCKYNEYGPNMGFESMKDYFENEPYEGQAAIVQYLRSGKRTFAGTGVDLDFFTGERIGLEQCGVTDGEYSWMNSLAYYVQKYNLRLPKEFEKKVLSILE